jgi:hypothetical protein
MRTPRTRLTDLLRRLAALGLVAWLGGAGCVLGCSAAAAPAHAPRADSHSDSVGQPDSCAAMRGHDCCAGVEEKGGGASAGAENRGDRTAMRCPLGGRHASDPARKVRVGAAPTAYAPATQSPAPAPSYSAHAPFAAAPVRDRGGTYLRCCAFLI